MASPCEFPEQTTVVEMPPATRGDPPRKVPVLEGTTPSGWPLLVSCWELSNEEVEEIVRTRRVWLGFVGVDMAPAFIDGKKNMQTMERPACVSGKIPDPPSEDNEEDEHEGA